MGKILIIGAGGIGAATARQLASSGHKPFLIGRNAMALELLAQELGSGFAIADVNDREALAAAIAAAGPVIDGLCYAVGTITLKPLRNLRDEDFRLDFEVNALGAVRSVQFALPTLKASTASTASIVLFSSVAVGQGFTAHASISMAKGAVEGLVHALAAELAPKIRVNGIAPSLTRTPLARVLTSHEASANAIAGMHALQRLGEADDVAALASFLLGPQSGWMTGQVIGVDGGRSTLRTKG